MLLNFTPSRVAALPVSLVLLTLSSYHGAKAQEVEHFQWGFSSLVGTSVPTCQQIGMNIIETNGSNSSPPYYMIAYPLEGTPRTYALGNTPDSLEWQQDYEAGTQLLLQVVDSKGVSGGTPRQLHQSVAGRSTDCVQTDSPDSNPAQAFSLSANVTGPSDRLGTCDFWGLTVKGGQWPYTWSLVALQSAVVTNVTSVSANEDTFTYVNRADPERIFVVAATDSTGKYAYGRTAVNTTGSTNIACRGRAPSFGNSEDIAQEEENNDSSSNMGIIIGAAVAGVAVLALVAVAIFFWRKKRRSQQRKDIDLIPTVYPGAYPTQPFTSNPSTPSFGTAPMPMGYQNHGHNRNAGPKQAHNRYSSNAPLIGDGRMSKREEANAYRRYRDSGQSSHEQQPGLATHRHDRQSGGSHGREEPEDEIVIQHRDGGAVNVREVPPAYDDVLGSGSAGPSYRSRAEPPPNVGAGSRQRAGEDEGSEDSHGSQAGLVEPSRRRGEKPRHR